MSSTSGESFVSMLKRTRWAPRARGLLSQRDEPRAPGTASWVPMKGSVAGSSGWRVPQSRVLT
jgi:hypothetical protein